MSMKSTKIALVAGWMLVPGFMSGANQGNQAPQGVLDQSDPIEAEKLGFTYEGGIHGGKNPKETRDFKLKNINIRHDINCVNNNAFRECHSIERVVFEDSPGRPSKVASIGIDAFYFCDRLREINIPSSVTSIGEYAFNSCISLTHINIPC